MAPPPVTEFAILNAKPGMDLMDPNATGGASMQDGVTTCLDQDGCQRLYLGVATEDPSKCYMMLDWDSIGHHKQFMGQDYYKPFVEKLVALLDSPPQVFHVPFTPFPPTASLSDTSAGTTEILTVLFPVGYSAADQDAFLKRMKQLCEVVDQHAPPGDFSGAALGFTDEAEIDSAEGKAKAAICLLGWRSVQAHKDFQGTKAFADNIHLLRDAKDLISFNVVHVSAREYQAEGGNRRIQPGQVMRDEQGAPLNP